jgi:hypothetical protein
MSRRLLVAIILVSVAVALLVVANMAEPPTSRTTPEADDQSGRSLRDRQVIR